MTGKSFFLEGSFLRKIEENTNNKISFNFVLVSSIVVLSMIVVMLSALLLLR